MSKMVLAVSLILLVGTAAMRFTGPDRPYLTGVEQVFRDLVAPLQGGVTVISRKTANLFQGISTIQSIQRENAVLRRQLEELTAENNRLKEFQLENARLRKLLRFTERSADEYQVIPARVIARDPSNWFHTFTLDVGTDDGIAKDMAVITHQGLVGRVAAVSRRSAEVLTVVDQEGAVGALVQDSRVPGVVEGIPGGSGKLQMIHLPHDAPVRTGQVVVTSGLGGVFPKGIRIGYITEVVPEASGLMKKALVKPFVPFDRVEEVLVVVSVRGMN